MKIRILHLLIAAGASVLSAAQAAAAVPISQRDALVALYDNTDGATSWTNNTNWLSGDPCENGWYGVQCDDSDTTVTTLDLQSNGLAGTLPADLADLMDLTGLDLGNNQLSGVIPSEVGNLLSLGELDLEGNELTGSIPWELGNLASLEYLWLGANELNGSLPPNPGEPVPPVGLGCMRQSLERNDPTGAGQPGSA